MTNKGQLYIPGIQPKIALGMIVKNEENVIEKTLASAIDAVDCMYIFDTGSTDNTINIINTFAKKYPTKKLYLKQGEFENFEVTRNTLLEWIDNHIDSIDIDFILLLDAND